MVHPGSMISTSTSIYQVIEFIQRVTSSTRKYDDVGGDFGLRLEKAILFLDEFHLVVFKEETGLIHSADLDLAHKIAIDKLIQNLAKDLAQYQVAMMQNGHDNPDLNDNMRKGLGDSHEEEGTQCYKGLKESDSWLLFRKDSLMVVLQRVEDWTENLREILALAMQIDNGQKDEVASGSFESREIAKRLGLALVAKRQRLVTQLPAVLSKPLEHECFDLANAKKAGALYICRYTATPADETKSAELTVIEYKEFDDPVNAEKKRFKSLVTILQSCDFAEASIGHGQKTTNNPDIRLNVLRCIGYIEESNRAAIIYKLPPSVSEESVVTLHQMLVQFNDPYVDNEDIYIASLGDRFFLAYNFALTVANLHACGLVHKNICSKALLLIRANPLRASTEKSRVVPFLIGFGYARPASGRTLLMPADNADNASEDFYRHPNRQGNKVLAFTKEYDIYAVGVVLLEIGVWRPIGDFRRISAATAYSGETVRQQLISVAKTELERSMGQRYMEAVLACLQTEFGVHDDDEANSKLALAFRDKVLEPLEAGINL